MNILNWTNEKETIDIDTQIGVNSQHWGLPFGSIFYPGRHNQNFDFNDKGDEVTFKTIPSEGWYFILTIHFLCFWVEIEFNRWYDATDS